MKIYTYAIADEYGRWVAEFPIMEGWEEIEKWGADNGGSPVVKFWSDNIRTGRISFKTKQALLLFVMQWS